MNFYQAIQMLSENLAMHYFDEYPYDAVSPVWPVSAMIGYDQKRYLVYG